jgi:NDP-sugar pyrophosphorylase family protein
VINGDILTRLDFRAMLEFHRDHKACMTVAVKGYEIPLPFGVVQTDGVAVIGVTEKPTLRHFINAGIYLLEPVALSYIAPSEPCNMTDLIQRLVDDGRLVVSFPVREYWLDIGHEDDYRRAQDDAGEWRRDR